MAWTEQQVQTLKKMWGNGYSASDIAKNLGNGVTRNAVIGKAHRLKLSAGATVRSMPQPPSKNTGTPITKIKKVSAKKCINFHSIAPVQQKTNELVERIQRQPLPRISDVVKRTEGIPVTKAGEHHCRWPIGDPRSPDFRFCGCKTVDGLPYCVDHARIAYQTVSRKVRANANADAAVPVGEREAKKAVEE
ncbi:MAG: GcrA family cell cycle regulator [Bdellovibrionales bacterium]